MMGFLNYLVQKGLLGGCEVSFLPVGHTHEEVDALFGTLARKVLHLPWLAHLHYR